LGSPRRFDRSDRALAIRAGNTGIVIAQVACPGRCLWWSTVQKTPADMNMPPVLDGLGPEAIGSDIVRHAVRWVVGPWPRRPRVLLLATPVPSDWVARAQLP
jgi:hypothetical protein